MHRYFQGTHPISVHCYYRFSDFPLITKLILHYYIIGNDVFVKIVREVGWCHRDELTLVTFIKLVKTVKTKSF